MNNSIPTQNTWTGAKLASARWQELHIQLSSRPGTAEYGWARHSSMICKWRALPAVVSAATSPLSGVIE
jgi:hypothetical protein